MWPFGMSRYMIERFLQEYDFEFIQIMLDNYATCVDEVLTTYMEEDACRWAMENDECLEVSGWI